MKDFLIIGSGLAGSLLGYELIKRDQDILIIDDNHQRSSSKIAAGIINPITGKRFAYTEDFDTYFKHARSKYDELEREFSVKFFIEKDILRVFQNEDERDHWQRKKEAGEAQRYVRSNNTSGSFNKKLNDPLGSVRLKSSGYCKTQLLLTTLKEYFRSKNVLEQRKIRYFELEVHQGHVRCDGEKYRTVVFCEGYQAQFNPFFGFLPFNSVKGEILTLKMDSEGLPDTILNKGKWCAPTEASSWTAGATYIWDDLDCETTQVAKEEILEGIQALVNVEPEVLDQKAAVRPVMKDQKPVMGRHPFISPFAIFNGLGSKGFLMAPFYAELLADHLSAEATLPEEVSIERFIESEASAL